MEVWEGSGSLWGAPGEHLGTEMVPKSAKKSVKRGLDGQFWRQEWANLARRCGPKSLENRKKKIDAKIGLSFLEVFFD